MTIEYIEADENICAFCKNEIFMDSMDIGYNIDTDGEEHQHMRYCKCGAKLMFVDACYYDEPPVEFRRYYGNWFKDNGVVDEESEV